MALNFPDAPAVGVTHVEGGLAWRWSGAHWTAATISTTPPPPGSVLTVTDTTVLEEGFDGTVLVQNAIAAPITITLPVAAEAGQAVTVKDASGTAGTYPVTITGPVEGAGGLTLSVNYAWAALMFTGSEWQHV